MDQSDTKDTAITRPSVDRLDDGLSWIEQQPAVLRLALVLVMSAVFLLFWLLSMLTSTIFVMPIWVTMLADKPYWLLPLFLLGPVGFILCVYFVARVHLWRAGELRRWSNKRLIRKTVFDFAGVVVSGHIGFLGYVLFRAGHPLLATLTIIVALSTFAYSVHLFLALYRGAYPLDGLEELLFPNTAEETEIGKRNDLMAHRSIALAFGVPIFLFLYFYFLLSLRS